MRFKSYAELTKDGKKTAKEAMDSLGYKRYCCRRMFLCHSEELVDAVLPFRSDNYVTASYSMQMEMSAPRRVGTE